MVTSDIEAKYDGIEKQWVDGAAHKSCAIKLQAPPLQRIPPSHGAEKEH
jgi:hypothetical protein